MQEIEQAIQVFQASAQRRSRDAPPVHAPHTIPAENLVCGRLCLTPMLGDQQVISDTNGQLQYSELSKNAFFLPVDASNLCMHAPVLRFNIDRDPGSFGCCALHQLRLIETYTEPA